MRKVSNLLIMLLLVGVITFVATAPASAQSAEKAMPKVGQVAPDFTLNYFDGNDLKPVSLSQYRGKKNVVLAFYIFAFTGG